MKRIAEARKEGYALNEAVEVVKVAEVARVRTIAVPLSRRSARSSPSASRRLRHASKRIATLLIDYAREIESDLARLEPDSVS